MENFAFVTEKNGFKYYRSITNPKDEVKVDEEGNVAKCRIKDEVRR